jgi:hypothetical protein
MLANAWNKIKDWFRDRNDRNETVKDWNNFAKDAFISGIVPAYLKSRITKGNSKYKHKFSHTFNTGFRVEVLAGRPLTRDDLIFLGDVILGDTSLVRKLVVLGFDTLEVHGENDSYGLQWQLITYLELGS